MKLDFSEEIEKIKALVASMRGKMDVFEKVIDHKNSDYFMYHPERVRDSQESIDVREGIEEMENHLKNNDEFLENIEGCIEELSDLQN